MRKVRNHRELKIRDIIYWKSNMNRRYTKYIITDISRCNPWCWYIREVNSIHPECLFMMEDIRKGYVHKK